MKKVIFVIGYIILLTTNIIADPLYGPAALANLGATCYMNSTLQCLYQIEPLTNFLLTKGSIFYEPGSIAMQYIDFINKVSQKRISKEEMEKLCIPVFTKFFGGSSGQQDASEFLNQFIDVLADADVKPEKKDPREFIPGTGTKISPVSEFFYSLFFSTIETKIKPITTDSDCTTSTHSSGYGKIDLEIQKLDTSIVYPTEKATVIEKNQYKTLESCLETFTKTEILTGDDRYRCPNGTYVNAKKKVRIQDNPEYLIIAFKRFVNAQIGTADNWKFIKVSHPISFPLHDLDLKPYMTKSSKQKETKYDLVSFVQQSGSLNGGHYTSYVKSNNKWYHCNDSSITKRDEANVKEIADAGIDGGFTPYILFYKRRDTPEVDQTIEQSRDAFRQLEAQLQALAINIEQLNRIINTYNN